MQRKNIDKCRELRKNQTDAEQKLWGMLRNRQLFGVKFRRQVSFDKYIIDFYSPEYKLGIEVDGGQHYSDNGKQRDELRTEELSRYGVHILRFSNLDVLNNIEGVCMMIWHVIEGEKTPHLNPLPSRGEETGKGEEICCK